MEEQEGGLSHGVLHHCNLNSAGDAGSQDTLDQWFKTGLDPGPTITLNDKLRPKSRNIYNFSNLLNKEIVQFESEIVE